MGTNVLQKSSNEYTDTSSQCSRKRVQQLKKRKKSSSRNVRVVSQAN